MSRQIAVRIPDDLADYIDQVVREGRAPSRAALVVEAVERDRRRRRAEQDAAILAGSDPDRDLDGLAEYAAQVRLDDLD
jgi:Arc/MetJ-type ribon-helix-helix transcriptional regulator